MPSVKFYLKHAKRNGKVRKTEVGICAKINVNGKRFEVPTGERIKPSHWNPNTQRPRAGYRGAIELNNALDDFAELFRSVWRANRTASPAELKQQFLNRVSRTQKKTLYPALEKFIAQAGQEKDKKTAGRYEVLKRKLLEFNNTLSFDDLDMNFYDRFRDFLYSTPNPNYKDSTLVDRGDYYDIVHKKGSHIGLFDEVVNKYIVVLKTFLRWAKKRDYEVNDKFEHWPTRFVPPKPITLTIAELEKLESAPLTGNLAISRDYLIFECRTGQRISDIKRFNLKDFDGTSWTFYPRKGNRLQKKKVTVHFTGYCAKALDILQRYNFKMPALSEQKINKNIKLACKQAGIDSQTEIFRTSQNKRIRIAGPKYEFISTHTGRKTFITIALQFMSPQSVMQLAGIDSYATLKHYAGELDPTLLKEGLKEVEQKMMKAI